MHERGVIVRLFYRSTPLNGIQMSERVHLSIITRNETLFIKESELPNNTAESTESHPQFTPLEMTVFFKMQWIEEHSLFPWASISKHKAFICSHPMTSITEWVHSLLWNIFPPGNFADDGTIPVHRYSNCRHFYALLKICLLNALWRFWMLENAFMFGCFSVVGNNFH